MGEINGKSGHYCNYDDILKEVLKDGAKPEDLDTGWNGPKGLEGAQDGDIHARELVAYLFENWETYQGLIEKETSFKVPWTLDDKNPYTKFDLKIRKQVESLIAQARKDISAKSLTPDTPAYRKALAKRIFELVLESPTLSGKPPFVNYMMFDGGHPLSLPLEPKDELSALDHLATGDGSCTENTKVLFAVYSMAGFDCRAVNVQVDENGSPIAHVALQVKVDDDTWTIVDSAQRSFDPAYKFVLPLTNAKFAALHYEMFGTESNYKKATFMDPSISSYDLAYQQVLNKNLSEAEEILRQMHPHADDIKTEISMLLMLKRLKHPMYNAYVEKYKKAKPDIFIKYGKMAASFMIANDFAFDVDLLKDLAPTKEIAESLGSLNLFKAINKTGLHADDEELTESLKSDDADNLFAMTVVGYINSHQFDSAYEISKTWLAERPDYDQAKKAFLISCYHLGEYEEMIEMGEQLLSKGDLNPAYGYGMAMAYARVDGPEKAIEFLDAYIEKTPIEDYASEYRHTRIMLSIANGDVESADKLIDELPDGDPFAGFYKASMKLISGDISGANADMVDIMREEPGQYWLDIYLKVADFMPPDVDSWLANNRDVWGLIMSLVSNGGSITLKEAKAIYRDGLMYDDRYELGLLRKELDENKAFAKLWDKKALKYLKKHVQIEHDAEDPDTVTIAYRLDIDYDEGYLAKWSYSGFATGAHQLIEMCTYDELGEFCEASESVESASSIGAEEFAGSSYLTSSSMGSIFFKQ